MVVGGKGITCLSSSKDIHEGGLAGPTDPHEAGEHPRPEGPTDAQQQLQHGLTALIVHIGFALCCILRTPPTTTVPHSLWLSSKP